jgi:hypothetical protein
MTRGRVPRAASSRTPSFRWRLSGAAARRVSRVRIQSRTEAPAPPVSRPVRPAASAHGASRASASRLPAARAAPASPPSRATGCFSGRRLGHAVRAGSGMRPGNEALGRTLAAAAAQSGYGPGRRRGRVHDPTQCPGSIRASQHPSSSSSSRSRCSRLQAAARAEVEAAEAGAAATALQWRRRRQQQQQHGTQRHLGRVATAAAR